MCAVKGMPDSSWRLLHDPPGHGAWNMAVDEAIAQSVGEGRAPSTLRFYGWREPTVSLGYLQRSSGAVDRAACGRLGVAIVRRPTGGRAVLHTHELTYSAAVPADGPWGGLAVGESFSRMGQALVAGLKRLGVAATIGEGGADRSASPRTEVCFQMRRVPAILVSGRKLVGSAQRRWGKAVLQHGSLLLDFDAAMHQAVFPAWPSTNPAGNVTWLAALLGRMPPEGVVEAALLTGWSEMTGETCTPGTLLPEERGAATALVRVRYGDPAWTFQR
jgi:lipoyl(octanoyl) transferase